MVVRKTTCQQGANDSDYAIVEIKPTMMADLYHRLASNSEHLIGGIDKTKESVIS